MTDPELKKQTQRIGRSILSRYVRQLPPPPLTNDAKWFRLECLSIALLFLLAAVGLYLVRIHSKN